MPNLHVLLKYALNSLTRIKRFFLHTIWLSFIFHLRWLQKKDSKASSDTSTCHLTPADDSLNGFRAYYSLSTSLFIHDNRKFANCAFYCLTNMIYFNIIILFVNGQLHFNIYCSYSLQPLSFFLNLQLILSSRHVLHQNIS